VTRVWILAVGSTFAFGLAASQARQDLNLSAHAAIAHARVAPSTPPRRLLLVVLDGLRADVARTLPTLRRLEAHPTGTFVLLDAEVPTFSAPNYVALLSGVGSALGGVRNNAGVRATGLDSLGAEVRWAGGRTAVVSDGVDWWPRLFPDAFDLHAEVDQREAVEVARRHADAQFSLVHLCAADEAGHAVGAASPAYAQAARALDTDVAALVAQWGWPDNPVAVMTDHGHLPQGGHGGDEPDVATAWLVGSGAGFRKAASAARARMVDVAPTLAAVLGVSAPVHAEGAALAPLLDGVAPVLVRAQKREPSAGTVTALVRWVLVALVLVGLGRRAPGTVLLGALVCMVAAAAFCAWHGSLPSFSLTQSSARWAAQLGTGTLLLTAVAWRAFRPSAPLAFLAGLVLPGLVAFAAVGALVERQAPSTAFAAVWPIAAYVSALGASLGSLAGLALASRVHKSLTT
jgi:hypothetical protein